MNIFDATLKLKDHQYNGNPQLIKIDGLERSAFSPLPFLYYSDKIKKIEDYTKKTKEHYKMNFLFDSNFIISTRILKNQKILSKNFENLNPNNGNTKKYWNFLHENFPFCDVASYFNVVDLESYFNLKGRHYNELINKLGIDFFRNKKILEIGPGYGYLPLYLKENSITHQYYCADLVKRFDHDNFIEVDGYHLDINDKFDIILMSDVIQHLGSSILKNYIREIKSMLNDNGSFIIVTEANEDDYIMAFFGQLYNNMGIREINSYMVNLNFDIKPMVKLFTEGKILEFKLLEKN